MMIVAGAPALAAPPALQVSAASSVQLRAGGATPLAVTVGNTGDRALGVMLLLVSGRDDLGIPSVEVDISDPRGRWTPVPADHGMGKVGFTAAGLAFQTGESTSGFRVRVPLGSLGRRLHIAVSVQDRAGALLGSTGIEATVIDAAPRVSTTFPGQLRRGAAYREFDIDVRNPSTVTYRAARASISLTGLIDAPQRPGSGHLSAPDIRIEQLTGGRWTRLPVLPGSDPVATATLRTPGPDLQPGTNWHTHLRIRVLGSPATAPLLADYFLTAGPVGNTSDLSGRLVIQPRLTSGSGATPTPTASSPATPAPATPTASSPATPTPATPTDAAPPAPAGHGGPPAALLPAIAGALGLLLTGAGVLIARSRRNPTGG
jgi:hypothetical protein